MKSSKSKSSKRDIPMTEDIADVFLEAIDYHKAAGEPTGPNAFVFGKGDTFLCPQALYRNFKRRVERLGLEGSTDKLLNFHSLRHTYATLAIKRGLDVRSVASILGHSDVSVTLNLCASSDPNAKRAAMDVIGAIFKKKPSLKVVDEAA